MKELLLKIVEIMSNVKLNDIPTLIFIVNFFTSEKCSWAFQNRFSIIDFVLIILLLK